MWPLYLETSVNELDISTNNLRTIPPDIRNMQSLVFLDISRNPIQCQHPRDFSGLPAELAQLPYLRVIIMAECNVVNVPPVIWKCVSLIALDISRNRIGRLLPEIGHLTNLRYLSAQQTGIQTLPPELACCRRLTYLQLWGNSIRSLPQSMKYLTELQCLELTCRSFALGIDSYMDSLLQSGQIQSEHIPSVLFELPRLKILDLEDTKINTLPEQSNAASLAELYLATNFLKTIPRLVLNLNQLVILDISSNLITSIPDDIGDQTLLETLLLNNNTISRLPPTIGRLCRLRELSLDRNRIRQLPVEIGQLTQLKTLSLEHNMITTLPNTIGQLIQLETLVLSNNRLKRLPVAMHKMTSLTSAHVYKRLKKYGLWLHPNDSLLSPPDTVWRTGSTSRLFRHLTESRVHSFAQNIYRQKMILLGDSGAGKTRLVEAFITGSLYTESDTRFTNEISTVQLRRWTTPNQIQFEVFDLAGCDSILTTMPLFVDISAIYLIVFDISRYNVDSFDKQIGRWLDLVAAHVPNAVVHVVGTHVDLCEHDVLNSSQESVWQLIQKHVKIRREQRSSTNKNTDKLRLRNTFDSSEDAHSSLQPDDLNISGLQLVEHLSLIGESAADIQALIGQIESTAIDNKLFPHRVQRKEITHELLGFCKTLRRHQTGLYIEWGEVLEVGHSLDMSDESIEKAIRCLSNVGEIFWLPYIPAVSQFIFTRFSLIITLLERCFRRHDDPYFTRIDIFNAVGQFKSQPADVIRHFILTGRATKSFMLSLLFDLRLRNGDYDKIIDLLSRLDLLYMIYDVDSLSSDEIVLPGLRGQALKSTDEEIKRHWPLTRPSNQVEIVTSIKFFFVYPFQFMSRLACRITSLVNRRLLETDDVIIDDVDDYARLLCSLHRQDGKTNVDGQSEVVAVLRVQVRSHDIERAKEVEQVAMKHVTSTLAVCRGLTLKVKQRIFDLDSP